MSQKHAETNATGLAGFEIHLVLGISSVQAIRRLIATPEPSVSGYEVTKRATDSSVSALHPLEILETKKDAT